MYILYKKRLKRAQENTNLPEPWFLELQEMISPVLDSYLREAQNLKKAVLGRRIQNHETMLFINLQMS